VTSLAPTLEAFFTERLAHQRQASPHTIASYRDSLRLLLQFAQQRTGVPPSRLDLADLDAKLIGAFLDHLELERGSSVRTRNIRLAAVRALFGFAALRHPEHAALIQRVLDIPQKRYESNDVSFLDHDEVDALLAAPDRSSRIGRRDHALLTLAVQTGLRVSELTALRRQDVELGAGAHVTCLGKGRKNRSTPLTRPSVAVIRAWLKEIPDSPDAPLFPGPRGESLSRDAVRRLVTRHTLTAQQRCPSLRTKRLSPHVLRHTCVISPASEG
jgi:integrase/recombinase XerD